MNENGDSFGQYCRYENGREVVVYGSLVVLIFRSGSSGSYGRFRLLFNPVNRKYNNKIYLKVNNVCSKICPIIEISNRDCLKTVIVFFFFG